MLDGDTFLRLEKVWFDAQDAVRAKWEEVTTSAVSPEAETQTGRLPVDEGFLDDVWALEAEERKTHDAFVAYVRGASGR